MTDQQQKRTQRIAVLRGYYAHCADLAGVTLCDAALAGNDQARMQCLDDSMLDGGHMNVHEILSDESMAHTATLVGKCFKDAQGDGYEGSAADWQPTSEDVVFISRESDWNMVSCAEQIIERARIAWLESREAS